MAEDPAEDAAVKRFARSLALTAGNLLDAVPGRVRAMVEGMNRLVVELERVVGVLLGGGRPADGPTPAGVVPIAPPPAPVSPGCSPPGGLSFGGTGSCGGGGTAGKLFQEFAVLSPFSVVLPRVDREIAWLSREPLRPNSAPRPPNARPG